MAETDLSTPTALAPLRDEDGSAIVSPRVVRRMCVIAEAAFTTRVGPPPQARMDWLALEMEDYLARSGSRTRFILGLAVLAVWLLAPLGVKRLTSLERMSLGDRIQALTQLEAGRFGGAVLAVKALLCVVYYEHPNAAEEIGFDGLCLTEARERGLP